MQKKFISNQRGSTSMLFALSLIPLIGMVGASVDYARAINSKAALQVTLDAAALSLAASASEDTIGELQTRATNFVTSGFKPRGTHTVAPIVVVRSGGQIQVSTSATLPTSFMQVLGQTTMTVSGTATATFGRRKIEMALALDNTGSMGEDQAGNNVYRYSPEFDAGTKIRALKDASLEFVRILRDAATAGTDVKLGVVPFDTQVKVSTAYAGAGWIKYNTPGLPGSVSQGQWRGCLIDRDEPNDTADVVPDGTDARRAPAVGCSLNPSAGNTSTLASVQPLTSDFAAIDTSIRSMKPSGWTNVSMGAIWGTSLLSSHDPFTDTSAEPNVERSLLILTDGNNTRSRFSRNGRNVGVPCGDAACVDAMNAKTLAACTAAKQRGITVYTVRLLSGDADTLRNCASAGPSGQRYYDVQNLTELRGVLNDIARNVSQVRLLQ
jgi:Flp pilus assembly protein TadG